MNINAAIKFVEATGDNVLSKLAYHAVGRIKKDAAIEAISAYQLSDGGWTKTDKDVEANISIISSTWVAMQWLIWLQVP
ncbi:MAG: hypothetical protein QME41_00825 [Actinomycetota bacterium]|nr:hypothetical protein [Actinomycetota bacterium]